MAGTGCTPQQVWEEWDLPSIFAQLRYWKDHPPLHLLAAAYLGITPVSESTSTNTASDTDEQGSLEELFNAFPPPRGLVEDL